jgi:hypothetical protein
MYQTIAKSSNIIEIMPIKIEIAQPGSMYASESCIRVGGAAGSIRRTPRRIFLSVSALAIGRCFNANWRSHVSKFLCGALV